MSARMVETAKTPLQPLDLRGLRCPLPVLRLEAITRRLAPGTQLEVMVDDPIARVDIPHAMSQAGHGCEEVSPPANDGNYCVFKVTLAS